jgi:MlaC protein
MSSSFVTSALSASNRASRRSKARVPSSTATPSASSCRDRNRTRKRPNSRSSLAAIAESYGRYISAISADRFDSYSGQKLEVTGEQPAPFGLMVKSRIIKSNGEPVEVDYVMRQNGESWLIADIYLDSAISEVATRRSEFAAILKAQGIDGLIAALNRKADILTGTTARSS